MEVSEYLELNSKELIEIHNFETEIKERKLRDFFFYLILNAKWDTIFELLENRIPFYEFTDTKKILDKNILDCSNSISKCKIHIENIVNINEEKYFLIKEIFTKYVVLNLIEMQTIPEIQRDPYHIGIIAIATKLLLENPSLTNLYDKVEIEQIKIIKRMVEMEEKFPAKNTKNSKVKI